MLLPAVAPLPLTHRGVRCVAPVAGKAKKPRKKREKAPRKERKKKKEEEEAKPVKIKVIPPRYQKQQRRGGTKAYADMSEAERQRDRERKEQYGQQLMAAMQAKQQGDAKYQAMQEVRLILINLTTVVPHVLTTHNTHAHTVVSRFESSCQPTR